MSVLKAQLFELERAAETLERIVYNQLTALMSLPDREVEKYEAKVLRKLERLDELQDEIDTVVAKLKEAGEYQPVRHTGNVYEYKPPKYERPKPEKKPKKARKVYPIESPKPKRKAPAKPKAGPPKVKPERKPKPTESKELISARRRVYDNQHLLRVFEAYWEKEEANLQRRLEERLAKVAEVADIPAAEKGAQRRHFAKKNLANVQKQIETLPERKQKRLDSLNAQLEKAKQDVESLTESHSQ